MRGVQKVVKEKLKNWLEFKTKLEELMIEKKLKTKSYTKELFNATDYPALADNRTDNMGNSIQKRYRVKPIRFNGMDIFVSTQFFDSDRDEVIAWYKSHLS